MRNQGSTNCFDGDPAKIVLNSLRHPMVLIDTEGRIVHANAEAEVFFRSGMSILAGRPISDFVPFGSPLLALIEQARQQNVAINEYRIDVSSPRLGSDRMVDIHVAPVAEEDGAVALLLQERSVADTIDRQMVHRGAARSVSGLAAMLAHEIKNPLAGIRGAAQLLEHAASDEDRALTALIKEETDRIVALVDRMEVFSDERPVEGRPVNIHSVLDHVKSSARNGFAQNIDFVEDYDPSLPPVAGNRDQLVQVFLNLVKNAAEALDGRSDGEIRLTTAYRPGVRIAVPGSASKVALPLEFCVHDNGPGVADEIRSIIFDPFVTSKQNGSGLGLALVAKIVGAHGGVVECHPGNVGGTVFRILMPAWRDVPMLKTSGREQEVSS